VEAILASAPGRPDQGSPLPDARKERTAHTVLYVEDDLSSLALVEAILASGPGRRTLFAVQGRLGVELARAHLPDLVLLDLRLPDIPGEEVLRRLRADPRTAGIPVLVVSTDCCAATSARLLAAGASAFLGKPLELDAFLAAVERLLPAATA
jgi:CheY-like chemotaxis protein